jgi:hypothetical protein
MIRTAILGFFCLTLAAPLPAAQDGSASTSRQSFKISRASGEIRIDGILDEPVWQSALAVELPYNTRPGENTEAPVQTTCYLAHDDDQFYLGCRAADPEPEKIRARLTDRDRAFDDDFIGVVVDTFNDERQAYEFFVNPLGVQMDLTNDDVNGNEDESWDAIWDSAGRITENGYEVEVAIPFSSLRFQRGAGEQTWGIDVVRFWPREHRYRLALNPLDREVSCYLCQASKIVGFAGAEPGKNLEINPTFTAGHSESIDSANPTAGLTQDDSETDLGLDIRWGFTPSLTLNGTINPDFSQVEADVAQLSVNEPFTLFFPEKRPFFLEGADIFSSPIRAVYTRTVGDPSWGAKITGKEGRHGLGVFAAQDEKTTFLFPAAQGSSLTRLNEDSTAAVVRYRADVGKNSAIGGLVTARDGEQYHNYVYGVDSVVRPTEADTIRFQLLGSETEYAASVATANGQPSGKFDGTALSLRYGHNERNWNVRGTYQEYDADFRADLGFVSRVDFDVVILGGEYIWWGEDDDWYSRMTVGGDWDETNEGSGALIERETEAFFWVQAAKQSFGFVGSGFRDRRFNGVEREENFLSAEFNVRPTKDLYVELNGGVSDRFDFSFAPPAGGARHGDELRWGLELAYNMGRHAKLDLSHDYRELDLPAGSPGVDPMDPMGMPIAVEGKVFEAHLTEARFVYQFNVRMFLRLISQYSQVDFDASPGFGALATNSDDLFNQFLFSYKLNPRTALFVGYADNRANQLDPLSLGSLIQTDRTFFAKIGYAWVP